MNLKELLKKISTALKFLSKPKEEAPKPPKPRKEKKSRKLGDIFRALKFWGKPKKKEEHLKPAGEKEGLKPWVFAHSVIGGKVDRLISLPIIRGVFGGLEKTLTQSRLRISFKAYVSLIILSSTLVFLITIFTSTAIFLQVLKMNLLGAILFGVVTSIVMAAVTFLILYIYPKQAASRLKTKIEANMPFGTSFMAVLSSAGLAPAKMFRALMATDGMEGFSDEAQIIVRNIDVFGQDVLTGVENVSQETVSKSFSNMLEGYITTIRAGGDVQSYLAIQARQSIEDKRLSIRRFIDSLTIISEMYVTTVIVAPIISAVILSIMAVLGGGFMTDPLTLIYLIAFLFLPVANVLFLLFVEMLSPKM